MSILWQLEGKRTVIQLRIHISVLGGRPVSKCCPSGVIPTIVPRFTPTGARANILGKWFSPSSTGFENILSNPPLAFRFVLLCWNKKGMPLPLGVFGCHLCTATWQAGAPILTVTILSCVARSSLAGRFNWSAWPRIAKNLTVFGLWKIVCETELTNSIWAIDMWYWMWS